MKALNLTKVLAIALMAIFVVTATSMAQESSKSTETKFKITTMTKESGQKIETIAGLLKGVTETEVKLEDKTIKIKYDSEVITADMLKIAIETMGHKADLVENKDLFKDTKAENEKKDVKVNVN